MPLSPRKDLERQQRRWADSAGIDYDARGFVRDPDANLRVPLAASTRAAFVCGTELTPRKNQPARFSALHSSAALVANVFDHWSARDAAPLGAALGLGAERVRLAFEEPLVTGVEGDPPLSDVVLRCESGRVVAIESKFGEWLVRRSSNRLDLKPKYFAGGRAIWREAGLPRCQQLADDLRVGPRAVQAPARRSAAEARARARARDPRRRGRRQRCGRGFGAQRRTSFATFTTRGRAGPRSRTEPSSSASRSSSATRFASRPRLIRTSTARFDADARVDRAYLEYLRARYFRVV